MSGIVLSAAVRQNLLSLQDTAALLSTTQNRLASGKKVNTALDNPTNFFTAQGLDNRASDINNLLDSISNGVQVLQAANTGLTSLVDTARSIANQVLQTTTGYTTKANVTTTVGAVGSASDLTTGGTTSLQGKTVILTPATGPALTLTFSNVVAAGNVNSLTALNSAISAAGINVTASISLTGFLTFTSNNDNASQTITVAGGAVPNNVAITGTTVAAIVAGSGTPVADANSQAVRASLVAQYNNIIAQITTTSQDASFNGINLLFGDDLKLTFNETGKSTLTVPGVTYDAAGLGLGPLTAGTDFLDNSSANAVITKVTAASNQLRSEASALGSNLSIVQIRQDFAKNLINVLQTGSANLTLADSNEEAANSQALSTRQSIAVSALALSNQSQQSVLQLLR
jgi:flagellin